MARVNQLSPYLMRRLRELQARVPAIRDVRGRGFMVGVELGVDGRPVVAACRERGLLINCTQERILRLLPAMTITKTELNKALAILADVLTTQHAESP